MNYQINVYSVYRDEERGIAMEHCDEAIYSSDWRGTACEDGLRWAKHNFIVLGSIYGLLYVGCVKIYTYNIGIIEPNGYCTSGCGNRCFEWKCDTGLYTQMPNSPIIPQLLEELKSLRKTDWKEYV